MNRSSNVNEEVQQVGPLANPLRRDPGDSLVVALPGENTPLPLERRPIARVAVEVVRHLAAGLCGGRHVYTVWHLPRVSWLCVKRNRKRIQSPAVPRRPSVVRDEEPIPRLNDAWKDRGDQPVFFLEAELALSHVASRSFSRRS